MQTYRSNKWKLCFSVIVALLVVGGSSFYAVQNIMMKADTDGTYITSYASQPDDFSLVARHSALIVEGTVEQVYPSQWTTFDGARPADIDVAMHDPNIELRTPVQISVDTVFKGTLKHKSLRFTIVGGNDGDYTMETDDKRTFKPGMRVIAFLGEATSNAGPWAKISPWFPLLYFIVDGETLQGPLKDINRLDFVNQFGEGAKR